MPSTADTVGSGPRSPGCQTSSPHPPARWQRWLPVLLPALAAFSVLPRPVAAEQPLYGELHLGIAAVSHSELDFYPRFASVTLGAWLRPNIGIEVFADRGLASDEERAFELSIEAAEGAALRLQSPPDDGLSGYVVLGYVDFTVEQEETVARGQRTVEADFSGPRVSIGIVQRLKRFPSLLVSAEYRQYYVENDIRFDGLAVGLRWNLP